MIVINKNLAIGVRGLTDGCLYHRQCYKSKDQGIIADQYWFKNFYRAPAINDPLECYSCRRYHVSVEDANKVKFIMDSI